MSEVLRARIVRANGKTVRSFAYGYAIAFAEVDGKPLPIFRNSFRPEEGQYVVMHAAGFRFPSRVELGKRLFVGPLSHLKHLDERSERELFYDDLKQLLADMIRYRRRRPRQLVQR